MNYLIDFIIVLCLGWGAYKGFRKGFIIQSFTILALVLAIWAGFAFSIVPFLKRHLGVNELAAQIWSFILIFVLTLILVYTSGYLVSKIVNAVTLGLINRLAGAAFGILANVLILSVIIFLFTKLNDKRFHEKKGYIVNKEILDKSYLYNPIGKVAPAICPDKIKNFFD
jgi:membrane protein required for colicin V production